MTAALIFTHLTVNVELQCEPPKRTLEPIFYSLQVPPLAKLLILLAADACAWIL